MSGKPVDITRRFWSKVDKKGPDDCWIWIASLNGAGYGQLWESMPSRIRYDAHRYSWLLHFGEIPTELNVLHKCDNKKCVNPNHLYLGTDSDNMQDAIQRGQKPIGTQCSFAKLTYEQVIQARSLYDTGLTMKQIADNFGVSPSAIQRALSKKAYKNVVSSHSHKIGHKNGIRKVTDEQIREIRATSRELSNKKLAEKLGLGITTVHYIRTGEAWSHIN